MLTPMTKMFSLPCDANVNNDIHDEDEDGVGDILLCLLVSSSLFAYLDRKLGQGGNTRCHMMKKIMMMRMIYKNLLFLFLSLDRY